MDLLLGVFQAAVIVSTRLGFHLKPQLGENLLLISFRLLAEFIFFVVVGQDRGTYLFADCQLKAALQLLAMLAFLVHLLTLSSQQEECLE